jgi:hypothetical protein
MRQHNDLLHISSMDIGRHSHRKKIAKTTPNGFGGMQNLCSPPPGVANVAKKTHDETNYCTATRILTEV